MVRMESLGLKLYNHVMMAGVSRYARTTAPANERHKSRLPLSEKREYGIEKQSN